MKAFLRTFSILLILAAAFTLGYGYRRWYAKPPAAAKNERKILYWVDPMHPAYKSDRPGIAPDCGMKLEPVYAGQNAPAPPPGQEMEPMPPGTIQISAEKRQLIGVRFGTAQYAPGAQTIRAVGKIAMDETLVTHVHARTEGWIDKVFVNFTGDVVRKGQPLLTIYSPELLATQQEFLLALKARDLMRHSTMAGIALNNDTLVEAARKRLQLWELSDRQIEEIQKTQKPVTNVTLNSPVEGYVVTRNAFANQKIMPDTDLYTVVDLSRVWVLANVFESDAPMVKMGQRAVVRLPYAGGREYRARVSYIQPQVDAQTRTIQVRLELANPGLALKPDMFVDVELAAPQAPHLMVPAEAVLDSGLQKTVFVDRGGGYFEPRAVETGARVGNRIEILKGLKAGERIVTSGNFLINSESQLKAAAEGMAMPAGGHQHD